MLASLVHILFSMYRQQLLRTTKSVQMSETCAGVNVGTTFANP